MALSMEQDSTKEVAGDSAANVQAPFAVVRFAGKQFKVHAGCTIEVDRIEAEPGSKVELSEVLLHVAGGEAAPEVGAPLLTNHSVSAKIVGHHRGEKVVIFKKKRRKGYTKKQGHRQDLTRLLIESVA
jgi:large subunit ribosomal protein L21